MATNEAAIALHSAIKAHTEKIKPLVEFCKSEEQTKITLINPFIEVLGHDVRDPRQVQFEYPVEARSINEKVDYAIMHEGQASILIEAKAVHVKLEQDRHFDQIKAYADMIPSVKFVTLTNGVEWHWYKKSLHLGGLTLEPSPFLKHNTLEPSRLDAVFLSQLQGRGMNLRRAEEQATETKLTTAIIDWIHEQTRAAECDEEFIAYLSKRFLGRAVQKNIELTQRVWRVAFKEFTDREIQTRLRALKDEPKINGEDNDTVSDMDSPTEPAPTVEAIEPKDTDWFEERAFPTRTGTVVLTNAQGKRAWRDTEAEHWQIEENASDLLLHTTKHLASLDDRGTRACYEQMMANTEGRLVSNTPETYIEEGSRWKPLAFDYYLKTNLSNMRKDEALKRLVLCVEHRRHPQDTLIEWWLPGGKPRQPKPTFHANASDWSAQSV